MLDRRAAGILCLAGGVALLSANDSIIKWLSPLYALHEIMLIRAGVALLFTLLLVYWEGGLIVLRTQQLTLHLLRGLLIVCANMLFFLALAAMPFAEAVALFFVAPLFISLLSQPVLGERVAKLQWMAIGLGLAGVIIMLRPGFGVFSVTASLPLFAALAYACMQMLTRRLGVYAKASALSFYIQIMFLAASAGIGLVIGDGRFGGGGNPTLEFLLRAWVWPPLGHFLLVALCGLLISVGGYLLSQAYRIAEAAVIAPFEYVGLPFALFWGYYIWGDWPDAISLLGSTLIVAGGLVVFIRESRAAWAARRKL